MSNSPNFFFILFFEKWSTLSYRHLWLFALVNFFLSRPKGLDDFVCLILFFYPFLIFWHSNSLYEEINNLYIIFLVKRLYFFYQKFGYNTNPDKKKSFKGFSSLKLLILMERENNIRLILIKFWFRSLAKIIHLSRSVVYIYKLETNAYILNYLSNLILFYHLCDHLLI